VGGMLIVLGRMFFKGEELRSVPGFHEEVERKVRML